MRGELGFEFVAEAGTDAVEGVGCGGEVYIG